ncbi:major facilitator superfamily domain-containing protein [Xylogone sp. PMI_703]|nr:major facilitator superfamily domain-containing protein [Xylogone sp. PMI_703]
MLLRSKRSISPEMELRGIKTYTRQVLLPKSDWSGNATFSILPVLFVMYALAFLDRINIGNAKIQGLQKELQLNGSQYNVALLIFFVPYITLEVPSNIILRKVAPSTWLSALIFFWGVAAMCQGVVNNYGGLVACRFFMGVFESGVFPGSAYLISMYYQRHELQKRWTFFFSSGLIAGAFGGLLAFALVKMDGLGGYFGWRWLFIIEGLATIVWSVVAKFAIIDWPENAKFLNEKEKQLLIQRLAHDGASGIARMDRLDRPAVFRILRDWKIWVASVMYMSITVSGYSTSFFIPTILNEFGYSPGEAQLHTIPIYLVCTVVTLIAAWASDHFRHRYTFTMAGILLATVGYIMLLCQGPPTGHGALPVGVRYLAVFFVNTGIYITQPIAIVWLVNNMGGHYKRSFGAAIQIGLGNAGGIIGSNIYLNQEAPRYHTGYGTALGMLWLSGLMCTVFYFGLMQENRKRDRGERDYRLNSPHEELNNLGDDHPEFRFSP